MWKAETVLFDATFVEIFKFANSLAYWVISTTAIKKSYISRIGLHDLLAEKKYQNEWAKITCRYPGTGIFTDFLMYSTESYVESRQNMDESKFFNVNARGKKYFFVSSLNVYSTINTKYLSGNYSFFIIS